MSVKDIARRVDKSILHEVDISLAKAVGQQVYDKQGRLLNIDKSDPTYGYSADMSSMAVMQEREHKKQQKYHTPRDHNRTLTAIYYHLGLSTVPSRQVIESIPDYRAAELEDSQDNDVDGSGGYRSNIKMFIRPYKREVEPLIYTIENERNARYEQLEREAAIV